MPQINSMQVLSKLSNLSVNNISSHPNAADSSRVEPELFQEDAQPRAHKPYIPVVTDVVVKHSGVFNSQRAGGMNSLEQLQFVQILRNVIVDEAATLFGTFKMFKVMTLRNKSVRQMSSLGKDMVHMAVLVAGVEGEWKVLLVSDETEYLADAVENLWEKVLLLSGEQQGKLKVGDKMPMLNEHGEEVKRMESGTTLATQV